MVSGNKFKFYNGLNFNTFLECCMTREKKKKKFFESNTGEGRGGERKAEVNC